MLSKNTPINKIGVKKITLTTEYIIITKKSKSEKVELYL